MKASEALRAAGDILAQPGAWIQRCSARMADGTQVAVYDDRAVHWCALGALGKVTYQNANSDWGCCDAMRAFDLLRAATGADFTAGWNDRPGRTQEEVVATFRKAEQMAKERGW